MKRAAYAIFKYLGGLGPLVLAAMLFIVLGTWAFIELTDYVTDARPDRWDRHYLDRVSRRGPEWLGELMEEITHLGGPAMLGLSCLVVGGYLVIDRKYGPLTIFFCTVSSGLALTIVLKHVINRASPGGGPQTSYPSGHTMMAAVVYLTIGVFLAQSIHGRIRKLYILLVSAFIPFIVGISRIYIRVHWPTDVLAGWAAGLTWALVCWVITERIRQLGLRRRALNATVRSA